MTTSTDTVLFLSAAENPTNLASNKVQLDFPSPIRLNKAKVALTNLNIDFSFVNVSSSLSNQEFKYVVDTKEFTVTIPTGNYGIDDIQTYLESEMYTNGHYLVNADGEYVYYLNLRANDFNQKIAFTATLVPATLPSGWSDPKSLLSGGLPGETMQLTVEDNGFKTLIGFAAATYPTSPETATYTVEGASVAIMDPISSVLVQCNLANSSQTNKSTQIIHAFPALYNEVFGTVVGVPIHFPQWMDCSNGTFNSIVVSFLDQNFNAISFLTSRHVLSVAIRQQ